ncbi:MAG: hypothetical protein Q8P36_01595 [bacterium]|nr:hypothetical protein [bacterium]
MPDASINLLPPERARLIVRSYALRLSVVVFWFITALAIIASLLLVPAYILLVKSAGAKEAHVAAIESSPSSADEAQLSARLAALSADAAIVVALATQLSVSGIVRDALAVAHPGIVLSGVSYARTEGGERSVVRIMGTAATRSALRSYQLALEQAPFAFSAQLPVSAYAKDSAIPFAIEVALTP